MDPERCGLRLVRFTIVMIYDCYDLRTFMITCLSKKGFKRLHFSDMRVHYQQLILALPTN
jgi:hypothetical protein